MDYAKVERELSEIKDSIDSAHTAGRAYLRVEMMRTPTKTLEDSIEKKVKHKLTNVANKVNQILKEYESRK